MNYAIFISYRRDGGAYYARILKAELEKRGYKDRVFLDYDELNDGRFDSRIMHAIECAPIFIFILSPGALDRCTNDNDWVRREIIYAMEHERQIVPVNCDGLFKEFPKTIPLEIKNILGQHQFSEINYQSLLNESIEKLIKYRIAPIISPIIEGVRVETGAEIHICTDTDCSIMRFGKHINTAKTDEDCIIHLLKGNHILEFVSTEFPEVKKQIRYSVPDNEYSDFIEIGLQNVISAINACASLIPVQDKNGKYGFINKVGAEVIPFKYAFASVFNEGLAKVVNDKGKYGFIDTYGKDVIPCKFHYAEDFKDGLAEIKDENKKYGFIDKIGNKKIPCKYIESYGFNEGLALIKKENDKYGFINKNGIEIIPCIYDNAMSFSEGLAAVKCAGKWGFINKNGEEIIPFIFTRVGGFYEGFSSVSNEHNKWGFIDKCGTRIIPCKYESAGYRFFDGLVMVKWSNQKWGIIDKTGKEITTFKYDFIDHYNDGMAKFSNKKREFTFEEMLKSHIIGFSNSDYGFIDKNGEEIIPCIYEDGLSYSEGLAAVKKSNKWGYIDKSGKIIIPCLYDDARHFCNGIARVKMNKKEIILNKRGEIIWPQEKE